MPRVVLVHWNDAEAAERIRELTEAGCEVLHHGKSNATRIGQYKAIAPDAFVVDLTRMPSHGREFAVFLRGNKILRAVPILFAGGETEKVEALKQLLPDAVYTDWKKIASALSKAIRTAPAVPIVPTQMMNSYAGRSAAQKIGIVEGCRVALIDPPADYLRILAPLPENVDIQEEPTTDPAAVTIWFVQDVHEYQRRLRSVGKLAGSTKLWVVWPKQKPKAQSGINQNFIRETALGVGLVDYKICSVNEVWTGMLFARSKATKKP
ncbi:MAG TPA: hypothetical protein VEQ63_04555 [Bryobacteraceae bacterium]|nr:hypothetical protein [Bryobacteraceae bacterium]